MVEEGSFKLRLMVLNGNGNVGIGTTEPRAKLHIYDTGTANFERALYAMTPNVADGSHAGTIIFGQSPATRESAHLTFVDDATAGQECIAFGMYGANDLMVLNGNGNVGIGTTDPSGHQLDAASYQGTTENSAIRALYPGGGRLLHAEFAALAHRDGAWTAVYGKQGAASSAAYFDGNVGIGTTDPKSKLDVKGSLSVSGTKNFLIDHPMDPEHKELIHSTLEGPEAGVFYRGEAQLSNGEATVMLPDYFEALTRKEDRTVLLTPKFEGDEQVSMLAASEVKDGKFRVRMIDSKNPSQKFYWEVKAVRADVEILEVERTKPPSQ